MKCCNLSSQTDRTMRLNHVLKMDRHSPIHPLQQFVRAISKDTRGASVVLLVMHEGKHAEVVTSRRADQTTLELLKDAIRQIESGESVNTVCLSIYPCPI